MLAGSRVTPWSGPDAQYVFLNGVASALQGTEGLRAAQVVCRIVKVGGGGDPLYEVQVYAEGNVHDTSRVRGPCSGPAAHCSACPR